MVTPQIFGPLGFEWFSSPASLIDRNWNVPLKRCEQLCAENHFDLMRGLPPKSHSRPFGRARGDYVKRTMRNWFRL